MAVTVETWNVYDGSAWRGVQRPYVYDGSAWREIVEGWVYDGSSWRQFFTECVRTLDAAAATVDGASGCCGCSPGKCGITVSWDWTGSGPEDHIRILRSLNGGSYFEIVDDLAVGGTGASGSGSYSGGCQVDGNTLDYRVRLEVDGGDNLACGKDTNQQTASASPCVV